MAWVMSKASNQYHYRGKKCDGFEAIIRPKIDLSWGMQNSENGYNSRKRNSFPQSIPLRSDEPKEDKKPVYYTSRKSQEQQLEKIMKKFKENKNQSYREKIAQLESLMLDEEKDAGPILHKRHDALNNFVNNGKNNKSEVFGNPVPKNNSYHVREYDNEYKNRIPTQQSKQKLRYFENSLLQQPLYRRDTIGTLLDSDKANEYDPMVESKVSRRSSSGNKKNESVVMFGDGKYNQFRRREEQPKDFHSRLQQMYQYEDRRNHRRVSQIEI